MFFISLRKNQSFSSSSSCNSNSNNNNRNCEEHQVPAIESSRLDFGLLGRQPIRAAREWRREKRRVGGRQRGWEKLQSKPETAAPNWKCGRSTHTHTCTTQVLREAGEGGREASIRGPFGIASGSCHVLNVQNWPGPKVRGATRASPAAGGGWLRGKGVQFVRCRLHWNCFLGTCFI